MTDKKRVLIVTQELEPYTDPSRMSEIIAPLLAKAQEQNLELRVLMPRFGVINERRHRLHEVVRLSGMNIIVDDDDYPLIIKVASLPNSRLQVYFLDNDDFFRRKYMYDDEGGQPFDDNADRMVFFCKGALETVKKFGWAPDIVHCHGWMTSLIPAYIKMAYKSEPIFQNSRVVYSLYDGHNQLTASENFFNKASINNLVAEDLHPYQNGVGINLTYGATHFSDGLIDVDRKLNLPEGHTKPVYTHNEEGLDVNAYIDFYHSLLS